MRKSAWFVCQIFSDSLSCCSFLLRWSFTVAQPRFFSCVKNTNCALSVTYLCTGKFLQAQGIPSCKIWIDALAKPEVSRFQCCSGVRLKVMFPLSTGEVIEVVNWLNRKTGCGLSLPLILLQVCQSHAIKCIACIALLLINKWQRRQCVAMCTWGQGLIALFQFFRFSLSLCLPLSRMHPPFLSFPPSLPLNRYWSFLFKEDAV